jgi:hypothetical protein
VRPTAPALVLLLASACGRAPEPAPGATEAAAPAESVFSRARFAHEGADAGSAEPAVPASADPAALDEILAAARPSPRPAATADGGAAIGADTGLPADAGARPGPRPDDPGSARAPDPAPPGHVTVGKTGAAPDVSGPALERAARAQIYWPLVQRCKGKGGALLPPEAVHVSFQLDADGYLVASTILATPRQERFAEAARCMARELGAATFRAPASARGLPHTFQADVPSVD